MRQKVRHAFGLVVAATAGLASPAPAQTAQPVAGGAMTVPTLAKVRELDLKATLAVLNGWLPGAYDNHEQVIRQSGNALMPLKEAPFRRQHIDITALPPRAGEAQAFRWTERQGTETPAVSRDEIIVPEADPAMNALRLRRYRPEGTAPAASPATYLGSDCDILLRYLGGQFQGGLAGTGCAAHGGQAMQELIVGRDFVWQREQALGKQGKIVWDAAPGAGFDWYQASRAHPFTCDVFGDTAGVMANTRFIRTIRLDDQGGRAEIPWPDGRTLEFTIHRRAFSSSAQHLYPLFRVHEKGNPVPLAYAYAEGDTERFGLNTGWFYVRCFQIKPGEDSAKTAG